MVIRVDGSNEQARKNEGLDGHRGDLKWLSEVAKWAMLKELVPDGTFIVSSD